MGLLGEQPKIGLDNGNKGAKTGEQWKFEPWDPEIGGTVPNWDFGRRRS